jgi:uncharacterized protein
MEYVWDESKRQLNITKHGIDFEDVKTVFDGPMLTKLDTKQDYGEDRWIGVGDMNGIVIVVVVYTENDEEEKTRIISARKATSQERQEYYEKV